MPGTATGARSLSRVPSGALLVALLISPLGVPIVGCTPASAVSVTDTVSRSVDAGLLHPGMLVRVEMFNGDVSVEPATDGRVTAVVTRRGSGSSQAAAKEALDAIDVTSGATDAEAFVRAVYTPHPDSPDRNAASAVVSVPPDSALIVRTSNGGVQVRSVAGPLNIHSSNGAVAVDGATQGLSIITSNAAVSARGASGMMSLSTSNASIEITDAATARLDVSTSNAAVTFSGSLGDGTSLIETSNAQVTVRLPATAAFSFSAETSNADISVSGFAGAGFSTARATLGGDIGTNPTARLNIHTSNQAIAISTAP